MNLSQAASLLQARKYKRYFQLSNTEKTGPCFDLPPSLSCPVQSEICKGCYGKRGHYGAQGPLLLRLNNWVLLHTEGFQAWTSWMEGELNKLFWGSHGGFFRFHSTGDVFSIDYWKAILEIVEGYPEVQFWLPTHNYKLMRIAARETGLPNNLTVGLSHVKGTKHGQRAQAAYRYIKKLNPSAHVIFHYVFRSTQDLPDGVWVCPSIGRHKEYHSCREANCHRCFLGTDHIAFRWH